MGDVFGKSPISDDLRREIQAVVVQSVAKIPSDYVIERRRIVEEMEKAAPKPYKNLLHADYPDKNGAAVNALARTNVTSIDAKRRICDQANKQLKPKIDAETTNMNSITSATLHKAVEKVVEKAVDKAVDTVVIDTNAPDPQLRPEAY